MNEIILKSADNLTTITLYSFFKYENSTPQYVSFHFTLRTPSFSVKTALDSGIEEIIIFKNDLKDIKSNTPVIFCPLGEFFSIKFFKKNNNEFIVNGKICDMLIPQSSLLFSFKITNEMYQSFIYQLNDTYKYIIL